MASDGDSIRSQILANCRLLLNPSNAASGNGEEIDVVVFGCGTFTGAAMRGMTPAIEGPSANTPDLALRKLYLSTCELLNTYIPKLGAHQRNIHGGGVFDEDLFRPELTGGDVVKKA